MSKNNLIKGTIILTIAGFLTRIIGFFYRIFLSNAMGAELLGIYQLVFPVYGICFTIYASGLQTSISRLVAAQASQGYIKNVQRILKIGITISVSLATLLSVLVYCNAESIAISLLNEVRCTNSLKILSYVFPFCGITACINGYYYGLKRTGIPASTQLLEQVIRVIFVYIVVFIIGKDSIEVTVELAAYGLVIGEVASNLYNIASLAFTKSPAKSICINTKCTGFIESPRFIRKELVKLTLPLTGNRLFLSLLHSFEAILIPLMLKRHGLSNAESLSIFGVINGMAVPFIMFPSAITNALAVLLLPTISEAQALNNNRLIATTTTLAIKYSLIIGIFSTGVFLLFGESLGITIYHNELAGKFLKLLALLCPFLYLTTTLGSVINGLGKAHITFVNSIIGMTLRIILIVFTVPKYGIIAYIISLLISQILITILDGYFIFKETHFQLDTVNSLTKPFIIVALNGFIALKVYEYLSKQSGIGDLAALFGCCLVLTIVFVCFMFFWKAITKQEFSR